MSMLFENRILPKLLYLEQPMECIQTVPTISSLFLQQIPHQTQKNTRMLPKDIKCRNQVIEVALRNSKMKAGTQALDFTPQSWCRRGL